MNAFARAMICYPQCVQWKKVNPILIVTLLSNVKHVVIAYLSSDKATAPEFQPPACCAFPAVWLWSGTWLTPTRGDLDGHVTERSWLGKGEWVISRAGSINWAVMGWWSGDVRTSAPLLAQCSLRIWTGEWTAGPWRCWVRRSTDTRARASRLGPWWYGRLHPVNSACPTGDKWARCRWRRRAHLFCC